MSNKVFCHDIEKLTLKNNNYRNVKYTHPNKLQLVLMKLKPGEEIGMEKHTNSDQFFKVEQGTGILYIKNDSTIKKYKLKNGTAIIVPSSTYHNIKCTGKIDLKIYTLYTTQQHKDGTIEKNKPVE